MMSMSISDLLRSGFTTPWLCRRFDWDEHVSSRRCYRRAHGSNLRIGNWVLARSALLASLAGNTQVSIMDVIGAGLYEGAHIRRSEEHTSELQSLRHLVCRLL